MIQPNDLPKDFDTLSPETRQWCAEILDSYELETHHHKLLFAAGQSWDRYMEARAAIDERGLTYLDRFGQIKSRPELTTERDAKASFARVLRELCLDVAPPTETNRLPRLDENRAVFSSNRE